MSNDFTQHTNYSTKENETYSQDNNTDMEKKNERV